MTWAIRLILVLVLVMGRACELSAQETKPATATTTTSATATATATAPAEEPAIAPSSREIRNEFDAVLRQLPDEVAMVLALDPSLLTNDAYLSGYPDLAQFVAAHPEVRRTPRFYMADYPVPGSKHESRPEEIFGPLFAFLGFGLFVFAVSWLVRAIMEQKRWNRLSRTQSEVHNKILDRFSSSDELLQYIKTPAGTKFLESAPIPLRAEEPARNAPMARIMWSIQIGVIVAVTAIGMLLVSGRFEKEAAQAMFAFGMITLSIGIGFIASAIVSLFMSRRLGMSPGTHSENSIDESGLVR